MEKSKNITRWGIGPRFALFSIIYAAIIVFIGINYLNTNIPIDSKILFFVGVVLIIMDILVYSLSVRRVMKAFGEGRLETKGIYKYARHPIYASWIVFIIPGTMLIYGKWLGLTIPIFMYLVFRILIGKEEKMLEERFGRKYLEYKKKTGSIFPKF
ncbi:hypothetical protein A3K73_05300 [Candidatus Pacearchaeota archaeon RBG_13_36_9]|nr:MAG: hypothetical protein A3K73_05300 [Candidatus Pacearchaeota archaeon RBG_13_36_9]